MIGASSSLVVHRVTPSSASVDVTAWSTVDADHRGGYRLDVADTAWAGRSRMLHVLSIGGGVTAVSMADQAGRRGVRIEASGGRVVTVRFDEDVIGGTLEDATGTSTLGEGVAEPPLFAP